MYTASLDNGLRIIFQPSESEVVYCGYVICAGTRHEAPEDSGMAHFIEHMSFKGTQRRKSRQINDYLERVGGELNAFTSKQETVKRGKYRKRGRTERERGRIKRQG